MFTSGYSYDSCFCSTTQLSVYDLNKRELFSLPLMRSRASKQPSEGQCGIHSLAINPSQTVLATGAENTNDIAFYSLPTFDPLAIGEVSAIPSSHGPGLIANLFYTGSPRGLDV